MLLKQPLIASDDLVQYLDDPALILVDCRFELADSEAGERAYNRDHIPGARYMHLERDLSGPVKKHGGRHPLPNLERFSERLGAIGIDASKSVVAYDDQGGAMAARFWWMLRYLGHEQVAVLDGGYQAWKARGYPVTNHLPRPEPVVFSPRKHALAQLVHMEEVREGSSLLIDSRDLERFQGKKEPIDAKAGHIPRAVNRFWKKNLTEDGYWKHPDELKKEWAFVSERESPIVYCGSGVTACANLLSLQLAGIQQARLYIGSWSDWISYEENLVEVDQ